jgi:catechol 2,3-dioxygenase-like lactoylglutathione lyase family enzyme
MNSQTESPVARGVHHVGMSVRSLDAALAFWEPFLGLQARWRQVLDRPYLGEHVGYPGVRISAAMVDLPGGGALELLEYLTDTREDLPDGTANPGNVHLCLNVDDARSTWERACKYGAIPIVESGPIAVDAGPNLGAYVSYMRIHDGITLELFQPPRS